MFVKRRKEIKIRVERYSFPPLFYKISRKMRNFVAYSDRKMKDTRKQFEHVIAICRDLFAKKLQDYGVYVQENLIKT